MLLFEYVWKLPLIFSAFWRSWTWLWLIKLLEKWARKTSLWHCFGQLALAGAVMKICPQKKRSGHSCTCECHGWSSSLCAYAFRISETEESNNFKLLSVISVVCKDLGPFSNDIVHLLCCLDGKQSPASATYHSFDLWAKEKPGEILKLLP